MKEFHETAGVDVSKLTLDAWLHRKEIHCQVENNAAGFEKLEKWIRQNCKGSRSTLLCFEHTGLYSLQLAIYLAEKKIPFSMISALEIKKSLGVVRGKNDKVDAKRIAEYAYLRRQTLTMTVLPSEAIQKLKELLSFRERMVTQRAGYKASFKEFSHVFPKSHNRELFNIHENLIGELTHHINAVEEKIKEIIEENPEIARQYRLITSVVGIGLIVAAQLIVSTNCFTAFSNSRKFACYCGVAPFKHQSGTSINSKARVSQLANKKIKALLDRSASTAILYDPELKQFYNRRVSEGKTKRSTLNIIRNKIIHRVFAVVKRETPYVKLHRFAA